MRLGATERQTARLLLRPLGSEHLADYARLIERPEVHRYLSRASEIAADPLGQAGRIVGLSQEQWRERGYGPYAVFTREEESFVGRGGFFYVAHSEAVEINYMFDPSAWGRGFATELAAALVEIGFDDYRFDWLIATTNPDNVSSRRVLEKVGFKPAGTRQLSAGRVVELYELRRSDWQPQASV